jgi:predicted transcriptional regulator
MPNNSINYSLGPLEKEILKISWTSKIVCVRHILDQLPKNLKPAYTTVMTIMNRMVDKGILKKEKQTKTCYYQTTQNKNEFLASLIKKQITTVINQYGAEVLPILQQEINHLS